MSTNQPSPSTSNVHEGCLAGGGEMGALMRSFDWSTTSIGPITAWPQSLKTALSILLASGYPMYIAWGPEFIQFYNDAYRPILGSTKHPRALGQSTPECFEEIWDFIGPMFHRARTTGEATTLADQLLSLDRHGFLEECYFTFSYSAIPNEIGGYDGVFVTVIETTERVLSERRITTLRELATATAQAHTTEQACTLIEATLSHYRHDLPFMLLYLLDEDGTQARLLCVFGLGQEQIASLRLQKPGVEEFWPLREVQVTGKSVLVTDVLGGTGRLPVSVWPEPPRAAMVLPITQPGHEQLAGFLVTGISARLELDDAYRGYLDLVAGSVATVVANARAYEGVRKRAEALTELDRVKTAFFSNVSHEFRTPLTLLLGPVEDALSSPNRMLEGESLEVVHRNSIRLLKLVNTLLDFSSIEASRVRAVYEPVDLGAFTAELAGVFRSAIERVGMSLRVDCPSLSEPVYIDREMWEKIVLNLLSNAFKFTFEGEIRVSLEPQGGDAVLSVTDTGIGIAEDQLPHIFDRFHRIEGSQGRTHEGTGIGLALVHELVRLQGGELAVVSTPGTGTTFSVSVPLGTAHLAPEQLAEVRAIAPAALRDRAFVEEALRWLPDSPDVGRDAEAVVNPMYLPESGPSGRRARIVLADDNADMRDYTRKLLSLHYDVEAVSDGEEALAVVQSVRPDLVLSDVMMPHLDGFGLLKSLRSDPRTRTVPIILLSARAGEEAKIEGLEAGADDYLIKPFSARELLASVKSHLELQRLRQEAEQQDRQRLAEIEELNRRLLRSMRETHHRVKNNLQVISAMIEMQVLEHAGEQTIPLEEFVRLKAHVHTLSIVHDLLTLSVKEKEDAQRVSTTAVLERLLPMLQQTAWQQTVHYSVEDVQVTSKQCIALALILNELVSNALKHGKKEAQVRFTAANKTAILAVYDDGEGFPEGFDPEEAANTGLELVDSLVRTDLLGTVQYNNQQQGGGQVVVTFPLPPDDDT